jgi:metacaspase-1
MSKKAVVIGINDYAPVGSGGPDLSGCVNDARDMANTLVICGFQPANIRILTNQNATRARIISYLNWLLKGCASGDSLAFYYSGHGTRVANIGTDLEIDGLDEAICPHDFSSAGVLRDDDFKAIFDSKLKPGVNLEVFFDCCHSGTGTRNMNLNLVDGETTIETPRYIEPMLEDEFYYSFSRELTTKKSKKDTEGLMATKALVPAAGMNHTLWAACKDNQVAMEGAIGGVTRGYFTYHLCKVLRATTGNITRRLLDAHVANALATMGAAQVNQTESKSTEFRQRIFT